MPFTPDDPANGAVVEVANADADLITFLRSRYDVRDLRHAGRVHVAVRDAGSFAEGREILAAVLDAERAGWRSGTAYLVEP